LFTEMIKEIACSSCHLYIKKHIIAEYWSNIT